MKLSDYPMFCENMTTLKETSADKRDAASCAYMTESDIPAVDFDLVKKKYVEKLGLSVVPMSNDALFHHGEEKVVFVEFKNGYIGKKEQFNIRKKIYDSVLIYSDITKSGISSMREDVDYVLVYNEDINSGDSGQLEKGADYIQDSRSFDSFAKNVSALARERYDRFGVRMFENYCFKRVHTYTKAEFETYLTDGWDNHMRG
ncbi:MAG: hypothetical protein HFH62_09955 [Lachnospiraceae bacterium]|nr:hypothetical protein [Lachnospiraceae bacterium]